MMAIEELEQDGYFPPEHEAFQATLTGILQLTQQQVNHLIGEYIDTATILVGPLDDNTVLSCFTPATKLSAGKRSWLYAFRDWIRQRQLVVGYGNVSSSEFTLPQLELMRKKACIGNWYQQLAIILLK